MRLQEITIHHVAGWTRDEYDEKVPVIEDVAAEGRVRPASSREITSGQQTLIVDAVGVLPPGTTVSEQDTITAGGKTYNVIGRMEIGSATGRLDHIHLDLQAVS